MENGKAHVETWLYREVKTSQDSIGNFVLTDLYSICSNCELCMPSFYIFNGIPKEWQWLISDFCLQENQTCCIRKHSLKVFIKNGFNQ